MLATLAARYPLHSLRSQLTQKQLIATFPRALTKINPKDLKKREGKATNVRGAKATMGEREGRL